MREDNKAFLSPWLFAEHRVEIVFSQVLRYMVSSVWYEAVDIFDHYTYNGSIRIKRKENCLKIKPFGQLCSYHQYQQPARIRKIKKGIMNEHYILINDIKYKRTFRVHCLLLKTMAKKMGCSVLLFAMHANMMNKYIN